jgi:hypothetical protein
VTFLITFLHIHLKNYQACDRAKKTVEMGSKGQCYYYYYYYYPNEMGGACSAYGGGERRVQGFGGET